MDARRDRTAAARAAAGGATATAPAGGADCGRGSRPPPRRRRKRRPKRPRHRRPTRPTRRRPRPPRRRRPRPSPSPAAAEAPAPPGAVATNVIPTDVTDTPASPIDHLFVPSLYGPTYTVLGRAGQFLGGVLSGGDRLERHRWGARRLLPVHRVGPRRRIVRLLQPAARPADADPGRRPVRVRGRPADYQWHAERIELHPGAARAAAHLRRAPPLLREPGVARLRAPRELLRRRSGGADPRAPHRRAAPVRVVHGRRDLALHGREPAVSRRSTRRRTRATGTAPASASSTSGARSPPPCRCRCTRDRR